MEQLQNSVINPDIIFLDINMPGANGWECLTALKSDLKFKSIPVIMYSTSSASLDGIRAIKNGALCYLEKPADFIKLKEVLEVIIGASPQTLKSELRRFKSTPALRLVLG